MRLILLLLVPLLLISCDPPPKPQNNANIAEKNKETALKNEVTRIIELAQKIEKDGRNLDIYRYSDLPGDKKACLESVAKKTSRLEDFKTRVEKLPDDFRGKLSPIYTDLDKCLACVDKAVESCKKARGAINEVIREIYPK